MKRTSFAQFPEHKQKGGNNKNNNMYIDEYRNMRVDNRDIKAALKASNGGKSWWIYMYLMAYPFIPRRLNGSIERRKERY